MSPRFEKTGKLSAHKVAALVSDALGLAHFFVAGAIAVLGEFTELFDFVSPKHGGIKFVFEYIDKPVFVFLAHYLPKDTDQVNLVLFTTLVIVVTSFLYGVACYIVTRAFISLFD